jgi:hypothetical protein
MVCFTHPFRLPGSNQLQPAGTYEVKEDREPIDVSWPAFRVSLTIVIPHGPTSEAWPISRAELDRLQAEDGAQRDKLHVS